MYKDIDVVATKPVKSFFVDMLTRDIDLKDAILDLLDNCVDGILRSQTKLSSTTPYSEFYAEIEFDKDSFFIKDNCGGIPWSMHTYAFRFGRAEEHEKDPKGSVGAYGIGMKRAIFKIGSECEIVTKNGDDEYEVDISPKWMTDPDNWDIPVKASKALRKNDDGTTIIIGHLHPPISHSFGVRLETFQADLINAIARNYAIIIKKGFKVKVNKNTVKASTPELAFNESKSGIKPFIFKSRIDDIDIFMAIGFTRPIPSETDVEAAIEGGNAEYASEDAGWTIVCNDRAVVSCDKTELTGWGVNRIPRFHTQFIAISGIIEFKTTGDPKKLPTTTTKRGINANSTVYLRAKDKMSEGLRIFINYTNKWKGNSAEAKKYITDSKMISFDDLKRKKLDFKSTKRTALPGEEFSPPLPLPKPQDSQMRRICFAVERDAIEDVSKHLFGGRIEKPSLVGEECFKSVLTEARR